MAAGHGSVKWVAQGSIARSAVIRILGELRHAVSPSLIRTLLSDPDTPREVVKAAVYFVKKTKDAKFISNLIELTKTEDQLLKREVIEALGTIDVKNPHLYFVKINPGVKSLGIGTSLTVTGMAGLA